MGGKSSKTSSKPSKHGANPPAVNVQQENVEAGGFHVVELHMPTLGMSFTTFALIVLAIAAIYICCRCCKARVAAAALAGPAAMAGGPVGMATGMLARRSMRRENRPMVNARGPGPERLPLGMRVRDPSAESPPRNEYVDAQESTIDPV